MKKAIIISSLLVLVCVMGIARAGAVKVVVIPLGSEVHNLKNIITVSEKNGDFTNLINAINSIPVSGPDIPSITNRYLIVIGPGNYFTNTNQIIMREWVGIQGAGEGLTHIVGAVSKATFSKSAAMVISAKNATLSDVTIQNTGGLSKTMGLWIDNSTPSVIQRVTVIAPDTTDGTGIYIGTTAIGDSPNRPLLTNVTASGYVGMSLVGNKVRAFVRESTLKGVIHGLVINGSGPSFIPRVVNSKIEGGRLDLHGNPQCLGNYDENLGLVSC